MERNKTAALIAGITFGLFLLVGCKDKKPTPENKIVPIEVTAAEYYRAYDGNEVAANQKFEGKTLKISGTVEKVGIEGGDTFINLVAGDLTEVRCFMKEKEDVSPYQKGQNILLIGVGSGLYNADPALIYCKVIEK